MLGFSDDTFRFPPKIHRCYASLPRPYGKAAAVAGDEVRHLMAGGPEVQTDLQKVWASFWVLKSQVFLDSEGNIDWVVGRIGTVLYRTQSWCPIHMRNLSAWIAGLGVECSSGENPFFILKIIGRTGQFELAVAYPANRGSTRQSAATAVL